MVFTTADLGRRPIAFPDPNGLGPNVPRVFREEFNYVGVRDNIIFFFQLVPLDADMPNEELKRMLFGEGGWARRFGLFLDALRRFLDGESEAAPAA